MPWLSTDVNTPGDKDKSWQVEMAIPLAAPAVLGGISKIPPTATVADEFCTGGMAGSFVLSTDRGNYKPEQLKAMEKLIPAAGHRRASCMHRPESWGMSILGAGRIPCLFQPDPTEWAGMLCTKSYAQKWHYKHERYTDSLDCWAWIKHRRCLPPNNSQSKSPRTPLPPACNCGCRIWRSDDFHHQQLKLQ
jgi:hypothetical protein